MFDLALVRFIPKQPRVPFISVRYFAIALSVLALIASVFLFFGRGLNYGIDFRGGITLEVDTGSQPDTTEVKNLLEPLGLGNIQTQTINASGTSEYDFLFVSVVKQPGEGVEGEEAQQIALELVKCTLEQEYGSFNEDCKPVDADGNEITDEAQIADVSVIRGQQVVGGKVSGELTRKGIMAVFFALIGILIYITIRFDWQFAVGAVLALAHDVILTIGFFSLIQVEFNLSIIAAILTIVGYSLNDTVIVYDRIRENLRKYKKLPLPDVLNLSINDTLSRTILTSLTTLTALLVLFFFGGPGLRGFSDAMIWGVIIGTYSSIFVASPLLLLLGVNRHGQAAKADAKAP